jgi:hypothetical protein
LVSRPRAASSGAWRAQRQTSPTPLEGTMLDSLVSLGRAPVLLVWGAGAAHTSASRASRMPVASSCCARARSSASTSGDSSSGVFCSTTRGSAGASCATHAPAQAASLAPERHAPAQASLNHIRAPCAPHRPRHSQQSAMRLQRLPHSQQSAMRPHRLPHSQQSAMRLHRLPSLTTKRHAGGARQTSANPLLTSASWLAGGMAQPLTSSGAPFETAPLLSLASAAAPPDTRCLLDSGHSSSLAWSALAGSGRSVFKTRITSDESQAFITSAGNAALHFLIDVSVAWGHAAW